jgi:hypothetical protein
LFRDSNKAGGQCRQADSGRCSGNPFKAGSLTRKRRKNGRKAMYIGIGGLILLIILLMILL